MAFLRFSRDKRGYEHFYLIQPAGRKGRPRVLYWFRTPPNVKVGRTAFDPEIQRALESSNPDVAFDWTSISQTPIPAPSEGQRWKERRRAERAMRDAAEADEGEAAPEVEAPRGEAAVASAQPVPVAESPDLIAARAGDEAFPAAASQPTSEVTAGDRPASTGAEPEPRRRRRRRRRRGGRGSGEGQPGQQVHADVPESHGEQADPGADEPEEGV